MHELGGAVRVREEQAELVRPWRFPIAGTQIFMLSDLGLLDEPNMATRAWLAFGQQLRAKGFCPTVLLPLSAECIPREITAIFNCYTWDRLSQFEQIRSLVELDDLAKTLAQPDSPDESLDELLVLLSPALVVEPTLLRAVRHLLPANEYDVGKESAAWLHRHVEVTELGFYFRPEVVKKYHDAFAAKAKTNPSLIRQVCNCIIQHHTYLFPTQRYEEIAKLGQLTGFAFEGLTNKATQHLQQLTKAFDGNDQGYHVGLGCWSEFHLERQDKVAWQQRAYLSALWGIRQRRKGEGKYEIPPYVNSQEALPFLQESQTSQTIVIRQAGNTLELLSESAYFFAQENQPLGSMLARLTITDRQVLYTNESAPTVWAMKVSNDHNVLSIPLLAGIRQALHVGANKITIESITKPNWTSSIGNNLQGLFVETQAATGKRFRYYWHPPILLDNQALQSPGFWYPQIKPDLPWTKMVGRDEFGLYADLTIKSVTQRFRWIQPGRFMMGSPETELERLNSETQHPVTLTKGYWMAETVCTQALWQAVMGDNPAHFRDDPNNPVEKVSWSNVQQFIVKLNAALLGLAARLPTEAEWEYACRAGTTTRYFLGDNIIPKRVNYASDWFKSKLVPVKSLPANPWGLYEIHGNVWEWCQDWYGDYPTEAVTDPVGPRKGVDRVLRGGSWINNGRFTRSAFRYRNDPHIRYYINGFRLALGQTAPPDQASLRVKTG